jgi:hypothetical protein
MAEYLSRDGSTVYYAVVDPAYTVFEVIQPASKSSNTPRLSTESQVPSKPQPNNTFKSAGRERSDLVRKYIYHFSLALAQHDCGKSNYSHLLKEYELDFEKDRASSEGYHLEIGNLGDTVEITAKPKSDNITKPLRCVEGRIARATC